MRQNMSDERGSCRPRWNQGRMYQKDVPCLGWNPLSRTTDMQATAPLPPGKSWDDGPLCWDGSLWLQEAFQALPCLKMAQLYLHRGTQQVSRLWAILALWKVHTYTAPCSPSLAETPWSCSLLLTWRYGPLHTGTKAQGKTLINSCKVLWNLFLCEDRETLRGQKSAPSPAMPNVFSSLQYKRRHS